MVSKWSRPLPNLVGDRNQLASNTPYPSASGAGMVGALQTNCISNTDWSIENQDNVFLLRFPGGMAASGGAYIKVGSWDIYLSRTSQYQKAIFSKLTGKSYYCP